MGTQDALFCRDERDARLDTYALFGMPSMTSPRHRDGCLGRFAQRRGCLPWTQERREPPSHLRARIARERVFLWGLVTQVRTLQHAKTYLFPATGARRDITFADLPFAAMAMDIVVAHLHVLRGQRRSPRRCWPAPPSRDLPSRAAHRPMEAISLHDTQVALMLAPGSGM